MTEIPREITMIDVPARFDNSESIGYVQGYNDAVKKYRADLAEKPAPTESYPVGVDEGYMREEWHKKHDKPAPDMAKLAEVRAALEWFNQWKWVSGTDSEKHSETIRALLQPAAPVDAPNENCKACEGHGVVSTTKSDLDGNYIEQECPVCFSAAPDDAAVREAIEKAYRYAPKYVQKMSWFKPVIRAAQSQNKNGEK